MSSTKLPPIPNNQNTNHLAYLKPKHPKSITGTAIMSMLPSITSLISSSRKHGWNWKIANDGCLEDDRTYIIRYNDDDVENFCRKY